MFMICIRNHGQRAKGDQTEYKKKEQKLLKKKEPDILESKSMITEMKNSLEGYTNRFEKAEETISQYDEPIEIIQYEEQKEKRMKKNDKV